MGFGLPKQASWVDGQETQLRPLSTVGEIDPFGAASCSVIPLAPFSRSVGAENTAETNQPSSSKIETQHGYPAQLAKKAKSPMDDQLPLGLGLVGLAAIGLCCGGPYLLIFLATLSLTALTAWAGYILAPIGVGLTLGFVIYRWRRRVRACTTESPTPSASPLS